MAGAAGQVLRHADEVVDALLFWHDTVRRLGIKGFPLRVVEQVVLRAGFEEAEHLGFGVKEQDGFVVTEKGLPLGTVLAPLWRP